MGSIELQIAHGKTPIAFMLPLKKAKDPETLRSIIRSRSGCPDDVKITMYSCALKVIHWDDWEDIVEADGYYMADLNDSWVEHLIAKGTAGDSTQETHLGFLGTLATAGQSFGAPAGPSLPTGSSINKQGPPAPAPPASKPVAETAPVVIPVAPKAMVPVAPMAVAPVAPKAEIPVTPKAKSPEDDNAVGSKVSESVVKELQDKIAEMNVTNVVYVRAQAKSKMTAVPGNVGLEASIHAVKKENVGVGAQKEKVVGGSRPAVASPPHVPFVRSTESYNQIDKKVLYGGYTKPEAPATPKKTQNAHKTTLDSQSEQEQPIAKLDEVQSPVPNIKQSYHLRIIIPNPRNIERAGEEIRAFVLTTPRSQTPKQILPAMQLSQTHTRLLRVQPSQDLREYSVLEVINPGSRFATTTFKQLEWPMGTYVCYEKAKLSEGPEHDESDSDDRFGTDIAVKEEADD
ncbi:hypothetical protein ABW21_db0206197 [Orbilia brochopaga]|nr:hypothetical protein ABW21_db0206197 [Drechslerella brochopaga]